MATTDCDRHEGRSYSLKRVFAYRAAPRRASDSPEGEQRIRHGENDVLRCFESTGTELGVGDVMAMLPGISKRTAQKRLKALFEKGEVARRKDGGAFVYFKE